jgi:hypothetical protein
VHQTASCSDEQLKIIPDKFLEESIIFWKHIKVVEDDKAVRMELLQDAVMRLK